MPFSTRTATTLLPAMAGSGRSMKQTVLRISLSPIVGRDAFPVIHVNKVRSMTTFARLSDSDRI